MYMGSCPLHEGDGYQSVYINLHQNSLSHGTMLAYVCVCNVSPCKAGTHSIHYYCYSNFSETDSSPSECIIYKTVDNVQTIAYNSLCWNYTQRQIIVKSSGGGGS